MNSRPARAGSMARFLAVALALASTASLAAPPAPERKTSENVKATQKQAAAAAARYREAKALERKRDLAGALVAYQDAAEAGHGQAQMRLAEIYDTGNTVVKRDYAKALYWYEKARAQGMPVPRPHPYVTGH